MVNLNIQKLKKIFLNNEGSSYGLFKFKNTKSGFTLLFAVIVSTLVLSVGASIINIALKQIILSGTGRESQVAFYAANTGLECALYWDLNGNVVEDNNIYFVFPVSDKNQNHLNDTSKLNCAGGNIATESGFADGGIYTRASSGGHNYEGGWNKETDSTTFRIAISNNIGNGDSVLYCAEVTVDRSLEDPANPETSKTIVKITSQGLNSCNPQNDKRAVQRGLVFQYKR